MSLKEVVPINPSQHLAKLRLLFVFKGMKHLLHTAFLREFEERHHMPYGKTAAELSVKWIIVLQMIIGFWHFQKTLAAEEVFAFYKGVQTRPAVTGVKKRDKVFQDTVAS